MKKVFNYTFKIENSLYRGEKAFIGRAWMSFIFFGGRLMNALCLARNDIYGRIRMFSNYLRGKFSMGILSAREYKSGWTRKLSYYLRGKIYRVVPSIRSEYIGWARMSCIPLDKMEEFMVFFKELVFMVNVLVGDLKKFNKWEVMVMRKFLVVFGMLAMAVVSVFAANPVSTVLTVTPGVTYSIEIASHNATHNLGTPNLNSTGNAITIGTATNTGNVVADFDAKTSNATNGTQNWTIAGSQSDDQYCLQVSTWATIGSTSAGSTWVHTNTQTEISGASTIAAAGTRCLFARILTPTTSSGTGTFTLTVSLYARAVN